MGRLTGFVLFFVFFPLLLLLFLFLSVQSLSTQVLSNHLKNWSEIWGYDRYEYDVVQESFKGFNFKMTASKTPLGHAKICPNFVRTSSQYRPRWLSWMRRPTGDQEVAGSTPAEVGNILSWRLIMKYFLRSFSPFR